jgi:hypothetical protein
MSETSGSAGTPARAGVPLPVRSVPRIPVMALGMSLGLFLAITFVLCVLFDLWFPEQAMNSLWVRLLPGFTWLTWPSFFLGLGESFAYGWYVALVFAPLYNFFAARGR